MRRTHTKDRLFGHEKNGLLFSHYAVMVYEEDTPFNDAGWGTYSEEIHESDALDCMKGLRTMGYLGMIVEIYI